VLVDGQNALLVNPSEPESLAEGILKVVQDGVLRDRLTAAVRGMNFGDASWQKIAAQTAELYRDLSSE
jgi:glycosyltransferase involved in cell wall biosynthesis